MKPPASPADRAARHLREALALAARMDRHTPPRRAGFWFGVFLGSGLTLAAILLAGALFFLR